MMEEWSDLKLMREWARALDRLRYQMGDRDTMLLMYDPDIDAPLQHAAALLAEIQRREVRPRLLRRGDPPASVSAP